ncbi:hypothetical protein DAEQUDRAFT_738684 [Daedalea quercina L-15889]|uniref:PHD-type domain-containing protein n=1 Tax=Daedalea quercina L-15889 TaxID=1314783 RepID=A0A165PP30_9APHY|nr:hypothetical protein DAEQUDRAFT_738684 [Daedalea quercina L-15889]
MSSLHDGSNAPNPAPPMAALPPPQLTPAMLPDSLPMLDGMTPMQVDGRWMQNASGFGVGEQATPGNSDGAPGLLPAFGVREVAHLPTPQSPGNAAFFPPTMTFPLGSPMPQRTMPQPHQQFTTIADPSTLQNRMQIPSRITEPQAFMTPESSPVYSRRPGRLQDQSPHIGSNAALVLSSPFTPRPICQMGESSQPRPATEPVMSALTELHALSPPLSRGVTPSSNLGSPFGGHRFSLNERPQSKAKTPARSHATTPMAMPPAPAPAEVASEAPPPQTPPPLSAPVPQRPLGGEIERIKAQMAVDHVARLSETEARRPDYLVRAQRPGSGQIIEPLDLEEPEGHPGLGVTVTPMRGRRIQLFQETSEESFEQSLLAGGYPGYGSYGSTVTDPQIPVSNKPGSGLSQRALHWLQQATPSQPGPSNIPVEPEEDWVPSEKEIRKRKRLAAFEDDKDPSEPSSRLQVVEIEGKGRVLITVPPEELPPEVQATLQTPTKKRPNPRRRRRGHRRGRGLSPGDDEELDGPNWIDNNFPWCTRLQERKDMLRMAKEERLKWIESYLDRDSDLTSDDEGPDMDQALQPAVESHDDDDVFPIRRGRGKMVPLKANPEARPPDARSRKNVLIPSDPADARAALLSKRSVRAFAERRRRRDEDEESSDEVNCPCGQGENGRPCVQCDDCKCWFHLKCMGIRSEAELGGDDDPWYCPDCLGVVASDPPSEPTFVPTDSELPRDGFRDLLLYQGSPKTPYTARRDPKTPTQTRERSSVYDSRSSWNSSGAGPVTPLSTERNIGVYKTPVFDSPFNPADTPSRSGKLSGPFGLPWADTPDMRWHMTPRQRSIWKTGGIHELVGDAHRHVTLAAYNSNRSVESFDDTPVLRNMSREDMSLVGRRLWGSPTSGSPSSSIRRSSLQDSSTLSARGSDRLPSTPKGTKELCVYLRSSWDLTCPASSTASAVCPNTDPTFVSELESFLTSQGHQLANGLRIAIALAALRHKPVDLSHEAYVLDLQGKFPCSQSAPQEAWRERALALEKQLRDLEIKYDGERTAPEQPAEPEGEGKKKKQKKKPTRSAEPATAAGARPIAGLRTILGSSQIDAPLPSLPSATHVLAAFETLDRLLFLYPGDKSSANESAQRLLAAARRAVGALGDNVARLLPPNPVLPSSSDALAALGTLAERLITTVLPLLSKSSRKQKRKTTAETNEFALDEILGLIATALLLPLVRSFAPLSTNLLSVLLAPNKAKKKKPSPAALVQTDIRPDVIATLDRITSALESFAASVLVGSDAVIQRIKHVVIIETARELHDLYTDNRPPMAPHATKRATKSGDAQRSADRLDRLARKDTLWYLCNTLQRVLPLGVQPRTGGLSPTAGGEQDELVEEALFGMLSRLLRTPATRGHRAAPPASEGDKGPPRERSPGRPGYERGLSEVERGMVLAVVERAWLGR